MFTRSGNKDISLYNLKSELEYRSLLKNRKLTRMKYLDKFFQPPGWQESSFTADDGRKIRYGHAQPTDTPVKGTVVLTTGYADFIETFHETLHEYLDRGYAVWIMDWAGQGGSDKQKSSSDKTVEVDDHVRHLRQFRQQIVKADADKPVFMSTHSMGGQIGLHYLHQYPKDFDWAIMAAPLVDFRLRGISRTVLKGTFKSAVELGLGNQPIRGARKGIQRQAVAERKRLRSEDPVRMNLHRTFFLMNQQLRAEDPTVGLLDSLLESASKINEEKILKAIQAPILLGVAGGDHIVDNKAILRASTLLPGATLVEIKDATHGMWFDRQGPRTAWWQAIDSYLQDRHVQFDRDHQPIKKPPQARQSTPNTGKDFC